MSTSYSIVSLINIYKGVCTIYENIKYKIFQGTFLPTVSSVRMYRHFQRVSYFTGYIHWFYQLQGWIAYEFQWF